MKINVKEIDKSKLFFTSDTHFCHKNIIKYCDRPFAHTRDMNDALISNWNTTIPEDGTVFMLGDFAMGHTAKQLDEIFHSLNGEKHLIVGNHDHDVLKGHFKGAWKSINDVVKITVQDDEVDDKRQIIVMCHYPMIVWENSHRGSWQLFGHVHGGLSNKGVIQHKPNQIDVGVDSHNYYPLSYQELKIAITKQNLK